MFITSLHIIICCILVEIWQRKEILVLQFLLMELIGENSAIMENFSKVNNGMVRSLVIQYFSN